MRTIEVPVALNYSPHFTKVVIPAKAKVSDVISQVSWMIQNDDEAKRSLKLRWIVHEDSALPNPTPHELIGPWYQTKGQRLVSIPLDRTKDLQEKLRDIQKSKVVQLLLCTSTENCLGRSLYFQMLKGASEDPIGTTDGNPNPSLAGRDRDIHATAQRLIPMYDGRQPLADNLVPNAAIYVPAFAEMWHALDSDQNFAQIELDSDIEDLVRTFYRELSAGTVKTEDDYLNVLERLFPRLFPGCQFHKKYRLCRKNQCEAEMDFAVTCITPYGEEAILVSGETKHRDGNAGSGPTQALYVYRRMCINPKKHCIFFSTCCPCLVVALSGHLIHIDAAYFTDAVYCTQMAVQSMTLDYHGASKERQLRVVRHFQLLRNTVLKLAQFYQETHIGTRYNSAHLLPVPSALNPDGAWTTFREFLDFPFKFTDTVFTTRGRAIYKGEIPPPAPVLPPSVDDVDDNNDDNDNNDDDNNDDDNNDDDNNDDDNNDDDNNDDDNNDDDNNDDDNNDDDNNDDDNNDDDNNDDDNNDDDNNDDDNNDDDNNDDDNNDDDNNDDDNNDDDNNDDDNNDDDNNDDDNNDDDNNDDDNNDDDNNDDDNNDDDNNDDDNNDDDNNDDDNNDDDNDDNDDDDNNNNDSDDSDDDTVTSSATGSIHVYVKLVDRYGQDVHRLLSDEGFAPKLRWFGPVCGGSSMVIMDKVDGTTIQQFIDDESGNLPELSEADLGGLDEARALLRKHGFVHGDLRPPNVMLRINSDKSNSIFLVDFDWAGKDGEVRYPNYPLNPDVLWPRKPELMVGMPITHEDDDKMRLSLLKQPKSNQHGPPSSKLLQMPPRTSSFERVREEFRTGRRPTTAVLTHPFARTAA
ncbi:transporter [Ganoderma sinense ZZ0214-1]|uniref:Transporter n=1 Tax=Ganoderma sinense ZZ0214-1 TaxID=1077348 RepID=A0A2G8S9Q5_9APHY|nr:transporter [Ganoderma sinense ZZ0214-1]